MADNFYIVPVPLKSAPEVDEVHLRQVAFVKKLGELAQLISFLDYLINSCFEYLVFRLFEYLIS